MKLLKTITILILLFGLPAGSWYFLQSGLDWRKVKAKELAPKTEVSEILTKVPEVKDKLKGRTTLLRMKQNESQLDKDLIDQFKDAYTFQYLTSGQVQLSPMQLDYDYLLIDTLGQVRQVYKGMDKETVTTIVEDIALVLPHRKPKDIKMKKQKEE